MTVLILGGSGFVGLNAAKALSDSGQFVRLFDRRPPPRGFPESGDGDVITFIEGDVRDPAAVRSAMEGVRAVIHAATITADDARDAADPETIIDINVGAVPSVLRAARDAHVRRIILLSSATAYGDTGFGPGPLCETDLCAPTTLYGISKRACEQIALRLADVWSLDVRIARLSGVFGPWEHPSGVRDTPSPMYQVMRALDRGAPATLDRPGRRDWTYAPDVGDAVMRFVYARQLKHRVYNVSSGVHWSVLDFAKAVAAIRGGTARLAGEGEVPTIDHYGERDRAPMDVTRMRQDLRAEPRTNPAVLAEDYADWWTRHGKDMTGPA